MIGKNKERKFWLFTENMTMPKTFIERSRGRILQLIWEWRLVIGSEYSKWSGKALDMMRHSIKWQINWVIIMPKGSNGTRLQSFTWHPKTLRDSLSALLWLKTMIVCLKLSMKSLKMILCLMNLQIGSNLLEWLNMQSNVTKSSDNIKRPLIAVFFWTIGTLLQNWPRSMDMSKSKDFWTKTQTNFWIRTKDLRPHNFTERQTGINKQQRYCPTLPMNWSKDKANLDTSKSCTSWLPWKSIFTRKNLSMPQWLDKHQILQG